MANYAYYALQHFGILPQDFIRMEEHEKAFIMATIDIKIGRE